MCGPLQDYALEKCGCGEYNPTCQADPTKCYKKDTNSDPTPSPTAYFVDDSSSSDTSTTFERKEPPVLNKDQYKLSREPPTLSRRLVRGRKLGVIRNESPTELIGS